MTTEEYVTHILTGLDIEPVEDDQGNTHYRVGPEYHDELYRAVRAALRWQRELALSQVEDRLTALERRIGSLEWGA